MTSINQISQVNNLIVISNVLCVRACVCTYVHACVCACAHACVRACVRVYTHVYEYRHYVFYSPDLVFK